jgi:hypothetical protein
MAAWTLVLGFACIAAAGCRTAPVSEDAKAQVLEGADENSNPPDEELELLSDDDMEHAIVCFVEPRPGCWRTGRLRSLKARADCVLEIPNGVRFEYPAKAGLLLELAGVIEHERACCSELDYALIASSELDGIALEVKGGRWTRAYLFSN